ncbi:MULTISPECIES: hypothetical protein [Novosphingobium]|nr:hypothetical protein [Novosphingobium resinovorum]
MALIRTTVDGMIGQLIAGGLLLYVGGTGIAILARALSLFTLML